MLLYHLKLLYKINKRNYMILFVEINLILKIWKLLKSILIKNQRENK